MAYDFPFIMQYLKENRVYPEVIVKSLKFLQIYVHNLDITIKDSSAFLTMSMKSMPQAFGVPAQKGMFPFLFAEKANFAYEGIIPEERYFMPENMQPSEYDDFHEWHAQEIASKRLWKFFPELLRYCENDCQILRLACQQFSSNMVALTGFNLLVESVSLPGF